jgi:hypothetical protein
MAFSTSAPVLIVQFSITTPAPFPNFGINFRIIKASNVILSVVPLKLTDVIPFLQNYATVANAD